MRFICSYNRKHANGMGDPQAVEIELPNRSQSGWLVTTDTLKQKLRLVSEVGFPKVRMCWLIFAVHYAFVRFWFLLLLLLLLLLMSYTKLQYFTNLHFPDLPFSWRMFPFPSTFWAHVAPHLSGTVPVAAALYTQAAERPHHQPKDFTRFPNGRGVSREAPKITGNVR